MIFSTLYEEIFFRGYLQSNLERMYGIIPSILLSALVFSFYHSAMGFIGFNLLILTRLFIVGIFFSITFSITKNIITSYIVNLPHAILTFYDHSRFIEYSNNFDFNTVFFCIVATSIAIISIIKLNSKNKRNMLKY